MKTPHTRTLLFAAGLMALCGLLGLLAMMLFPAVPGDALQMVLTTLGAAPLVGMAVTANQLVSRAEGCRKSYPVYQSCLIYEGTLAFVNSGGYLDDDTASGVNKFAGVAIRQVDNSSGSDGDLQCEVWRDGEFLLTGSGFSQATVGQPIYATDNYTITATGTTAGAVLIGTCTEYVSSTKVWVKLDTQATDVAILDNLLVGASADRATIKGIYLSAVVAVAVPTIADAESDEVDVDVSAGLTMQPAVGDVVIAIPQEALPTDCVLSGAYVSATDHVIIGFDTKEGGAGVTGANKNFKFLIIDLT